MGNTIDQARQRTRVMARKLREVEAVDAVEPEFDDRLERIGQEID